jgi:hypothetical protein
MLKVIDNGIKRDSLLSQGIMTLGDLHCVFKRVYEFRIWRIVFQWSLQQ